MADVVRTQKINETGHKSVFLLLNKSDGTGESAVTKVDISTLPGAPTKIKISKMCWSINIMGVQVSFDHPTDGMVALLSGDGELAQPIEDQGTGGGTGDIKITTYGNAANASYMIVLEVEAAV